MSLILFEGPAGTGKTTRLFGTAGAFLREHPLTDGQKVLALTKYHGSRQRLTASLTGPNGLGVPVECLTLDSYALTIAHRWRGVVNHLELTPPQADFQAIASAAAKVIEVAASSWVATSFPLAIVDEMQDCRGADIKLLAALEPHLTILAGADAFQDLNGNAENEAITWATNVAEVNRLTEVHRTNKAGILDAAQALRTGAPLCLEKRPGFEIITVRSAPQGGAAAAWRIKSWGASGQLAVISPVKSANPFVTRLTNWMADHEAKSKANPGTTAGPYCLHWAQNDDDAKERLLSAIGFEGKGGVSVSCTELEAIATAAAIPELREWARRKRFVKGCESVAADEISAEVAAIVRRRRVFSDHQRGRLHALTVHQAKNREFDSVIILWPMGVRDDVEQQRRLLYNAITRAKRNVLVIVDDPSGNRLRCPLFAGEIGG